MGTGVSLIGDEARALIGQVTFRAQGIARLSEGRRYAAAVGDDNPLYWNHRYARLAGYRAAILPPLFTQYVTRNSFDLSDIRTDGLGMASDSAGVPLPACPRKMAAGIDWHFFDVVYDQDLITQERVLESLEEKSGRTGAFVLVISTNIYTKLDNQLVARSRSTVIARPPADVAVRESE